MRQPVLVTLAVLITWYFSFLIILIIPLDVSNTLYSNTNCTTLSYVNDTEVSSSTISSTSSTTTSTTATSTTSNLTATLYTTTSTVSRSRRSSPADLDLDCSEPSSYVPSSVIYNLWRVVYWSSQFLTWLVLPLMQSFSQAGEFTAWGKLKSSLWDNLIFYTSYLFIAIILLVYIALQPELHLDWPKLKAIAAAASNTWGLFLLVFMMGYGLVEVPRELWHSSKRGFRLNKAYFKVSKLWGERSDAEGSLEDVLVSVETVSKRLAVEGGHLTELVDVIVSKVPLEMMERVRRRTRTADTDSLEVTEARLAKLHKQVVVAVTSHFRTEAQWKEIVDTVYWLEDNHKNTSTNERIFRRQVTTDTRTILTPVVEWYVRCLLVPWLYKILAVVSVIMSFMVTWSEVTFFSEKPTLSLFALFIKAASYNNNYRWIEIISFFTICYMGLCTFYTVFRVRVLNYYYLLPGNSDSYTLLFSALLLSRLTGPMCLNFLSIIHMDTHVISSFNSSTSYTKVMGHMDVVSIVQDGFNVYFPILLVVLTLATYFSLGSRLLSFLGFQQFLEQEDLTGELVEEGRELIKREKRRRERLEDQQRGRRDWRETRGAAGAAGEARQRTGPVYTQDTLQGDEDVLWEPPATAAVRNKEPPRNIFDDL